MLAALGVMAMMLVSAQQARAALIAGWNFNDQNLTVDHGAGFMTAVHPGGAWLDVTVSYSDISGHYAGLVNAVSGDVAGYGVLLKHAWAEGASGWPGPAGMYAQWQLDTTGYKDLVVSMSVAVSGGSKYDVSYSTDGVNFTNHAVDQLLPGNDYANVNLSDGASYWSMDLSSVTAIDNQATAYVRLVYSQSGSNAYGQEMRMDNVQFNATLVPEPGSVAMLGIGGLAMLMRRRRARA